MATPLIEVIEECEADIARFSQELEEIKREADEDGHRDEEETEEIQNFEDSIAELEDFVAEKRAEFERNEAEWNGLSSDVSELHANFMTLTEWGTGGLEALDSQISEMDTNANSRFYRDAITAYQAAQAAIDPLMEEYNRQSAAKLDYDEAMEDAWKRVEACRASDTLSRDITARLDQVETDFDSCNIIAERLDYEGALSALQPTLDEITNTEGMIEETGAEIERLQRRYGELLTKRSEALGKLQDHREMMAELIDQCTQAEATFNALINDRYFEQAEQWIIQTEEMIATTLERLAAVEAAENARAEKEAADQALLDKERDQLASELSADTPDGTLWKLYEWKDGDSFDSLAKSSKLDTADKITGHPNNKKASEYYASNSELPAGTLVCVLDPSVEVYELQVADEKHYLTKPDLDCIGVSDTHLMNAIAFSLNSTLQALGKAHDQINEAIDGWAGSLFIWSFEGDGEPSTQRTKAEAHEGTLLTHSMLDDSKAFSDAIIAASKDIKAWHDGLVIWLDGLQAAVNWKLSLLWIADVGAKAAAATCIVTLVAPAAVPGFLLYNIGTSAAAGAAAGAVISVTSDIGRLAASGLDDIAKPPTTYEVFTNMAAGATKGAMAAGFTSWFMQGPGPAVFDKVGTFASRSALPARMIEKIPILPSITRKVAERALQAGRQVPIVHHFLVVPTRVTVARLTMGTVKGAMLEPAWKWLKQNVNSLFEKEETAAIELIVHGIATDEACEAIILEVISENQSEFERLVDEEIEKYFADQPVSDP